MRLWHLSVDYDTLPGEHYKATPTALTSLYLVDFNKWMIYMRLWPGRGHSCSFFRFLIIVLLLSAGMHAGSLSEETEPKCFKLTSSFPFSRYSC